MPARLLPAALAATAAAACLTACGGDDGGAIAPAPATTSAPAATASGALTVKATEYAFAPGTLTAKAGAVTVDLQNDGQQEHELVLLETQTAPDALTVTGGRVSEADSVGEIEEVEGGAKGSHTFDLTPGTYVYVCNIPGHYPGGMRGRLVVR